ncbi:MAG: PEP-utilizing enzyme [Pseudomonadota bacterium]
MSTYERKANAKKKHRVVVLGAGSPHCGGDARELMAKDGATNFMNWILHAVAHLDPDLHFVSGYDNADQLRQHHPEIRFWRNEDWAETRAAWSLLQALVDSPVHAQTLKQQMTVVYSDIVFREDAVRKLESAAGDVVVAVDTKWRNRYSGRTEQDIARCEKVCVADGQVTRLGADIDTDSASAEFVGLVQFGARANQLLGEVAKSPKAFLRTANLSDLIEYFRINGLKVEAVDLFGDWAELNDPHDLARFVLGTKAQTLLRLKNVLRHGRIEDQVSFTVDAWERDASDVIARVQQSFPKDRVIVRSSALSEDGFASSAAGAYASILDVDAANVDAITDAIRLVAASYPRHTPEDEVLVQPMLKGVLVSGVAFTRTLGAGAPYIVVNYDDVSGSTESVTSGSGSEQKTCLLRRDKAMASSNTPEVLLPLLKCLREIEDLLSYDALDVEFAITEEFGLHILQVRPLVAGANGVTPDQDVTDALAAAERMFIEAQVPSPWVLGERTIFGIMPDWNPAEIVGKRPDPLAYSLYCNLICDDTWAKQRADFGYRDVRPQPLLKSFAGHPYVDVRASLNSFVPVDLENDLTERLVSFALDWLEKHPELHDKIEFSVIPTCLALDFDQWRRRFIGEAGFSEKDCQNLRDGLRVLTVRGMSRVASDLADIEILQQRLKVLSECPMAPLPKAFALLDDAKRFGTLPFAHLARNGFIAMTLLRSGVETGVISQEDMDDFLRTVKTVSHNFTEDSAFCVSGELSWAQFVDRYGHLRPGTYDVISPRYSDDPEQYLRPALAQAQSTAQDREEHGSLWQTARYKLANAMASEGLPSDIDEIEDFLRTSIEGREYAKFIFTRNLSLALELFAEWGGSKGLSRDELAMLDLSDLRAAASGSDVQSASTEIGSMSKLRHTIEVGKHKHAVAAAIELPPLLCNPQDLHVFELHASSPNFVGSNAVVASSIEVDGGRDMPDVEGRIVVIPSADPGYDWLFGQGIAGLITMYGGANSHMAIRAAEFNLPAAIGVGSAMYKTLSKALDIHLDPRNHAIRVIR